MTFHKLLYEFSSQLDGDVHTDIQTLDEYSTDASSFRMTPSAVIYPKNNRDIAKLVVFVNKNKAMYPELSLTARGAGSCRSGGPINNSIIVDTSRYLTANLSLDGDTLTVDAGVTMSDIDELLAENQLMIAAAPLSRSSATIGGMISNNSGSQLSHRYGNIVSSVIEVTVILADGSQHTFRPLTKTALKDMIKSGGFIGDTYRELHKLIKHYGDNIDHLRPRTKTNSSGYNIWEVFDEKTKTYNFAKLFCGAQGTLGIVTSVKLATQPLPQQTSELIVYVENVKKLDRILTTINRHEPLAVIGFNDIPFRLIIKYFNDLRLQLGITGVLHKSASRIKRSILLKHSKLNIVLVVKLDATTTQDLQLKNRQLKNSLTNLSVRVVESGQMTGSFWKNRRTSISLIYQKTNSGSVVPFLDDMVVETRHTTAFLRQLQNLVYKYKLPATIAGDFAAGSFRLTPLINQDLDYSYMYESAMRDLSKLTSQHGGTLAAQHNDGLLRGPWLRASYGDLAVEIWSDLKRTLDPMTIFNPHKKTDADINLSRNYLDKLRQDDDLIVVKNN